MAIHHKTFRCRGIVLKRSNFGEADRLVTLFTKEFGKLTCVAKGARKLSSAKRSCLEPGTEAIFFMAKGKTLDILTQIKVLETNAQARQELIRITRLYQVLEIIDKLTVDHQEMSEIYFQLQGLIKAIGLDQSSKQTTLESFRQLLQEMGFTHDKEFTEFGLKKYIESLAGRPLRAKAFLSLNSYT